MNRPSSLSSPIASRLLAQNVGSLAVDARSKQVQLSPLLWRGLFDGPLKLISYSGRCAARMATGAIPMNTPRKGPVQLSTSKTRLMPLSKFVLWAIVVAKTPHKTTADIAPKAVMALLIAIATSPNTREAMVPTTAPKMAKTMTSPML